MKISYKLLLTFGVSLLVALSLVCLCLFQMYRMQTMASTVILESKNLGLVTRSSIIGPMSMQTIFTHILTNDFDRAEAEWTVDVKSNSESQIQQLQEIFANGDDKAKPEAIKGNFVALVSKYEKEIMPLLKASKDITPEIKTKALELFDPAQAITDSALQLRNSIEAKIKHEEEALATAFKFTLIATSATSLVAIVMVLLMAFFVTRSIVKPLADTTKTARLLALGDINQKITFHSHDELGELADSFRDMIKYIDDIAEDINQISQNNLALSVTPKSEVDQLANSLNKLLGNWRNVLSDINNNAGANLTSSQQLNNAAESLSNTTTSQAAALEEVSSSIREFSGQVQKNTASSEELAKLANEATEVSSIGKERIGQTIAAINDIEASSKEIHGFVKVIDSIAFQTNLLALNAAVEAARAGKSGRGFAVVADEVRNLSNKSAEAAREISAIIEHSNQKVQHGLEVTGQTAESFENIIEVIQKTSENSKDVSQLSRQQMVSISQITSALQQIDNSTQNNAASAEETHSASNELLKHANDLKEIVGKFHLKN